MAGAEANEAVSQQLEAMSSVSGTVAIDTATVHGGARSFKCSTAGVSVAATIATQTAVAAAAPSTIYLRAYVNFATFPDSTIDIVQVDNSRAALRVTSGGVVQLWTGTGATQGQGQVGSNGPTLNLNQWYCFEIAMGIAAGSNDTLEGRVDGVSFAAAGSLNISDTQANSNATIGFVQAPGTSKTMYVDDVAVNDSSGSAQNSWCGPGKQVLLIPISDNARDTLWTGGAGGTSNLFDAVNNLPPTGTASETDSTQIEHAGGAAGSTDRYDANLTTYLTAGMRAGDKFLVGRGVIVTGEDIGTGDKLLSFEGLSNPVIASTGSFNVFTAGASNALGTYPSNWKFTYTGYVYNQVVTLGTSPVLRVVRPETASRVASVCFMGLFVEYEEGAPPELLGRPDGLRGQQQMQQLLAQ